MKKLYLIIVFLLSFYSAFSAIAPITGAANICTGTNTTLIELTPGGTWSSSNSSIAAIGLTSGLLAGISGGSATITYTVGTGYVTFPVTVNPVAYSITGGGHFCASGTGVPIGLSGSDTGLSYQLYNGIFPVDSPITGTGSVLNFGDITGAGIYTIKATNTDFHCTGSMTGSDTVIVNPLPNVFTVTGGGYYCVGGSGKLVGLSSSDTGISYQLFDGTTSVGSPISGTGLALEFGLHTTAGAYTVVAENQLTGCTNNMTGAAAIITSPNPIPYTLTGGGTMCMGSAGFGFTLSASNTGIRYQLYRDTIQVDTPVNGIGASITFPHQNGAGFYWVVAMDTISGCISNMIDSDTIIVLPLPAEYTVTGGGSYCTGGAGEPVGLSHSDSGFEYQLLYDGSLYGAPVNGNGHPLNFGLLAGPGYFTVSAKNNITGCSDTMAGSVLIHTIPLPSPIGGYTSICFGRTSLLYDATSGGSWIGSNTAIATIGNTSGYVSSVSIGTEIISYVLPSGCMATASLSINPVPPPITGPSVFCSGLPTPLFDTIAGGTWSTSDTGIALVGSSSGAVTGLAGGSATITYSLGAGCQVTQIVRFIPGPSQVIGPRGVCIGSSVNLTDTTAGGTWSSSNTAVAMVGTSGIINSVSVGVAIISYQLLSGCPSLDTFSVNPYPAAITGNTQICLGYSTTLSDSLTGGTWSCNTTSGIISAGISTGIINGLTLGTEIVTYTLPTSCAITIDVLVKPGTTPITGASPSCINDTETLTDGSSGGIWSSSNSLVALAGSGTGNITSLSAGTAIITYTSGLSGCFSTVTYIVNPLPNAYIMTGGGSYCAGGTGVPVGINYSDSGIIYHLYDGTTALGAGISGTGSALSFGSQTSSGNYTVISSNPITGCSQRMTGSSRVVINPLPFIFAVTGGGRYCIGGPGADIGLSGSQTGKSYHLILGGAYTGTSLPGSGLPLDFGLDTIAGTFKITAKDTITGCSSNMGDSAIIIAFPSDSTAVSLTSSSGDTLCNGGSVLLTANPFNGGSRPVYQWLVNGANVGIDSASFHYFPTNGAVITLLMSSSLPCPVPATVFASITMHVDTLRIPDVAISVNPGVSIRPGQTDTFTADVANGGPTPAYQWIINRVLIPGATNRVFTCDTLANNDSVSCLVTGSGICGLPSFNGVLMQVIPEIVQNFNNCLDDLRLFPNPNKGEFSISGNSMGENICLEIRDMLGRLLFSTHFVPVNGRINERIEPGNQLAPGNYLVTLRSDSGIKLFHMVIAD